MNHQTFATAITCIDGRTHFPVRRWLEEQYGIDFVDRITEPGVDRVLALGSATDIAHLREQAALSVQAHQSNVIVIVGHHDCAANPVSAEVHRQQILQALETVATWQLPAIVIGLWLNEAWTVEEVGRTVVAGALIEGEIVGA